MPARVPQTDMHQSMYYNRRNCRHCVARRCIALNCLALLCIALHHMALHGIAFRCIALHRIALLCCTFALYWIALLMGLLGLPRGYLCQRANSGPYSYGATSYCRVACRAGVVWRHISKPYLLPYNRLGNTTKRSIKQSKEHPARRTAKHLTQQPMGPQLCSQYEAKANLL